MAQLARIFWVYNKIKLLIQRGKWAIKLLPAAMDSLESFGLNGHLYREETQLSVLYIKLTPMTATHETQRLLTNQDVQKKQKLTP